MTHLAKSPIILSAVGILALLGAAAAIAKPTKADLAAGEFYSCVVKKRAAAAAEFILAAPGSSDARANPRVLYESGCFKPSPDFDLSSLRHNLDLARHGLAEALVSREFRASVPAGIAAVPALAQSQEEFDEVAFKRSARYQKFGPKSLTRARAEVASYQFLSRFGECVVRRNPRAAHRLVVADAGSNEEALAMAGVRPQLGTCIVEGQKLGMNLKMLRGSLAYNFYRLARAAMPAAKAN